MKLNIVTIMNLSLNIDYDRKNFNIIDDILYLSGIIELIKTNKMFINSIFISKADIIVDMDISEFEMIVKSLSKDTEIIIKPNNDSIIEIMKERKIIICNSVIIAKNNKKNNKKGVEITPNLIIISRNITLLDFSKHSKFCDKNIYYNIMDEEILDKVEYILIEINPDVYSEEFMFDMKNIFTKIYNKKIIDKIIIINNLNQVSKKKQDIFKLMFYNYKIMNIKKLKHK